MEMENFLALKQKFLMIKENIDKHKETYFFDVEIDCQSFILPAHKYVLSSRSEVLAKQLASGVNRLNWTDYGGKVGSALLRWIYTNEVVLDHALGSTVKAEQWLGLLRASYYFQLVSLFETCEHMLLSLVSGETLCEFHNVAEKVGADRLKEKCLEARSNVNSSIELQLKVDKGVNTDICCHSPMVVYLEMEKLSADLFEEMKQIDKMTTGNHEFGRYSDVVVMSGNDVWTAHAYFLGSRSKKFFEDSPRTVEVNGRNTRRIYFSKVYGAVEENSLLRWLYTDCVEFKKDYVVVSLLKASHHYKLLDLFDRCEQEIVKKLDITTCAYFHEIAAKLDATQILQRCEQLIPQYYNGDMDVRMESEVHFDNSLSDMMVDMPSRTTDGLLTLNDDCLLHVLRFISLVDLGSIKYTCKKLSQLADQCFKLYGDKSLKIRSSSMFANIWILKHFGKRIHSLSLDSIYERYISPGKMLEMISRFTGEKLVSISLQDCGADEDDTFECLKKVLKNVECIKFFWYGYDRHINLLLSYCENLKKVDIHGESIKLNFDWCSKNANVTHFTMRGLEDDEILEQICVNFTRLEHLSVDYIDETTNKIIHLYRLTHLRELKIEAFRVDIAKALHLFADKNVLEYLWISLGDMTEELACVVSDFPNLKKLAFENFDGFGENMQKILSRKLVNIEELSFTDCEKVTFKAITKIIANHLNLKKLSVSGCEKIEFIDRVDYLSLQKIRNLQIFLDSDIYESTFELIGSYLTDYVQIKSLK